MNIVYTHHSRIRMGQRGITELDIAHILTYPTCIKNSIEGTKEAVGKIRNKIIKIIFIETGNYIKIITVM